MKKLLCVMCVSASALAFSQRNSVSLSYGALTGSQFLSTFNDVVAASLAGSKVENLKAIGAIGLTYHRFDESERFGFGATVIYDKSSADIKKDNMKTATKSTNSITTALEAKYRYVKGDSFNMYGLLGGGYTFNSVKYNPNQPSDNTKYNHFNYQITPVGLEYGRTVKGFLELGFGYKGIVNIGVSYNFK